MNALLDILKSVGSVVQTLAKKISAKQAFILLTIIVVGGLGYLFWDRFWDYKLATFEKPVASVQENKEEISNPEKVQRITPKIIDTTAEGTKEE